MWGSSELIQSKCPKCSQIGGLKRLVVGDKVAGSGYGMIWCSECRFGIKISRVSVLNRESIMSYDEAMAGGIMIGSITWL